MAGLQELASLRPGGSVPGVDMGGMERAIAPDRAKLETSAQAGADLGAQQASFEADQASRKAEGQGAVLDQYAERVANAPQRGEMREVTQKMAEPFVPSQENARDLGTLFSLVNIAGFAIGAGGKKNAQAAMSAMNGMLEGHRQGRADLYKQERDKFDESMKQLKQRFDSLDHELKDALEVYKTDKEAGLAKVDQALASHQADFLRATMDKRGLAGMYDFYKQALGTKEKMAEFEQREKDRVQQQRMEQQRMAQSAQQHADSLRLQREEFDWRKNNPSGRGVQQQFMAQRAVNGLGGVASAVESLQQLPAGTTTGLLPNLKTKDGLFNYLRNAGGRKVTSDEAEAMNTLFTGIGRNLASIEASGAATGLQHLADQMQSGLYINAGVDTPLKVAIKLADMRRVATENIRPAIESGLLPPQQAEVARKLVERIEKAIPYTTSDVVGAMSHGRKTVREAAEGALHMAKEGDEQVSKSGRAMIYRNGAWEYK